MRFAERVEYLFHKKGRPSLSRMLAGQENNHFLTVLSWSKCDCWQCIIRDRMSNGSNLPVSVCLLSPIFTNPQMMDEAGVRIGYIHGQTQKIVMMLKAHLKR